MQVIKTPTGMIPVDEPAQCMTQTEYNNLPADKQKSGTYYIISGDGKHISLIIKDGVPLDSLPANNAAFTPPSGMNSTTVQQAITELYTTTQNMKHKTATAIASSTSWGGASAPYTNSIAVAGVTTNNIVEVGLASNANDDQVKACMKASIAKITQENGRITLYAYGKKPTVDIPLSCIIVNN